MTRSIIALFLLREARSVKRPAERSRTRSSVLKIPPEMRRMMSTRTLIRVRAAYRYTLPLLPAFLFHSPPWIMRCEQHMQI